MSCGTSPATGRVEAGLAVPYGGVHRDDVAAFLDAVLHEPRLNRVFVERLTSGQVPVDDAVARLVAGQRPAPAL